MYKKIAGLGLPLFFIQPVIGFCLSLFNIRSRTSAFVYLSFAMLFGYAISFTNTSADSYRYAEAFLRFDNRLDYNAIVNLYRGGELRDLYRLLLFYVVSVFSSNPKVMYAFAGLVYGIFSYLSLRVFVKEHQSRVDIFIFILALIFYTYISISNINGFRFNTGALVFFYSAYNYILQRQNRWIVGILITPLFHFSFVFLAPIFVLYRFIHPFLYDHKGVSKLMIYLFVITFIASWFLNTNIFNLGFLNNSDYLFVAIGNRVDFLNSSRVTDIVEKRQETSLFLNVRNYFDYGIKIYVFLTILYLNKMFKKMTGDQTKYLNLFAFILFFYTLSFILSSFPSGTRFLNIAHLFMILGLVKFYVSLKKPKIKKLVLWSVPVFSFNIVFINFLLPILILTPTYWYGNLFWIIIEGAGFNFF